jgi:hypothetical protein
MVAAAGPSTRGFNCGNCGAAVELRALQHTRAVACTSCGAILDPRDPNVHILQTAALKNRLTPTIPLGRRGTWGGHPYEVVGFQRRSVGDDDGAGTSYGWNEYVLFNPYQGFRYLSEYEGHWNDIRTIRDLPAVSGNGKSMRCRYHGTTYRHFQRATAKTDFVLGEFPWRVRVGDTVNVSDYVAPPQMVSAESTDDATTWSLGLYTEAAAIWRAFSLEGAPRYPSGVFANQPSPHSGQTGRSLTTFVVLALLLLALLVVRELTAARQQVFARDYVYQPTRTGEAAFVTDPFTIDGPGTIEIGIDADVRNSSLYLDLALINVESGTAWNVGREVSYFSGSDAEGPWTEGDHHNSVLLPSTPKGEYYLRVEPEASGSAPIPYTLRLRRDVPSLLPYGVALLLLLIPPGLVALRAASFENRRWQESDYAE